MVVIICVYASVPLTHMALHEYFAGLNGKWATYSTYCTMLLKLQRVGL